MSLLSKVQRRARRLAARDHHLLSKDQIARYRADGFVIPAYRVPEPMLNELQDALSEVLPSDPEDTPDRVAHVLRDPRLAAVITRFAQVPEILDMVGQLLGEDIALWGAGIFGKPPIRGKETPWHQDVAFVEFQAIRPLELCTVWIALDDSTPENGCVRYVSGSHQSRIIYPHVQRDAESLTLDHMVEDCNWSEARIRNAMLKRGQLSIHDVFLIHGSQANRSEKRRAGIALRYMPTTSYYDRDFAKQFNAPDRTVYLVRGIDRCGINNLVLSS